MLAQARARLHAAPYVDEIVVADEHVHVIDVLHPLMDSNTVFTDEQTTRQDEDLTHG